LLLLLSLPSRTLEVVVVATWAAEAEEALSAD
jgi:hypothetical protein